MEYFGYFGDMASTFPVLFLPDGPRTLLVTEAQFQHGQMHISDALFYSQAAESNRVGLVAPVRHD